MRDGPRTRAVSLKVEDLLDLFRRGKIRIPRFQRKLKWLPEDDRRFIDSVNREFPVGSLLFWEREAPAERIQIGGLAIDAAQGVAWYVVDGQQRIHALVEALIPDVGGPSGMALALRSNTISFGKPSPDSIPVKELGDGVRVLEWLERAPLEPSLRSEALRASKRLREYMLPAYVVETSDERIVATVFDRLNSYGKRLRRQEIFAALDASDVSAPSLGALKSKLDSLGFGSLTDAVLQQTLAAVTGADITRPFRPSWTAKERETAYQRAERALSEPLTFSLAGLQLKFGAEKVATKWRLPARGMGGRWLVKLPDPRHKRVPANEYAMMAWGRGLRLIVPQTHLVQVGDIDGIPTEVTFAEDEALAVERFDRSRASRDRIHTEDFLQVLGEYPDRKYRATNVETLARVVGALGGIEDLRQLIERLVFNQIIGNGDAHLKNWTLLYADGRKAKLSPAYDLVSTVQYLFDDGFALNLSRNKSYEKVKIAHFERLTEPLRAVGLPLEDETLRTWILDFADRAVSALPALEALVDSAFMNVLRAHWRRTPMLQELGFS